MVNLVISGRVGQDAKLTQNGSCYFSIASTRKGYKKQDGTEIADQTTWINVFKRNGEQLYSHIKKGMYLTVSGDNISTNVHDGNASLQINAFAIEFGGVAKHSEQTTRSDLDQTMNEPENSGDKEDLPF